MRLFLVMAGCLALTLARADVVSLSTSKFASHYGMIRFQSSLEQPSPGFEEAVSTFKKFEAGFPSEFVSRTGKQYSGSIDGRAKLVDLYWRSIDVLAYSAADREMLLELPDRLSRPLGGKLSLSQAVKVIDQAMKESQAAFELTWKADEIRLKTVRQSWDALYSSKAEKSLQFIAALFSLKTIPKKVEITVLPHSGGREGMTIQTLSGWKVVIGAEKYEASDFFEVVLHEAIHVLDIASPQEGFFFKLRGAMSEAKRSNEEKEMIPHLMMFFAAASFAQQVDPAHKPVGETFGAYDKIPKPILEKAKRIFSLLPNEDAALREAIKP